MQIKVRKPSRSFKTSRKIFGFAEMKAGQFPMLRRKVQDALPQRGMNDCHATARFRWQRFEPAHYLSGANPALPEAGYVGYIEMSLHKFVKSHLKYCYCCQTQAR